MVFRKDPSRCFWEKHLPSIVLKMPQLKNSRTRRITPLNAAQSLVGAHERMKTFKHKLEHRWATEVLSFTLPHMKIRAILTCRLMQFAYYKHTQSLVGKALSVSSSNFASPPFPNVQSGTLRGTAKHQPFCLPKLVAITGSGIALPGTRVFEAEHCWSTPSSCSPASRGMLFETLCSRSPEASTSWGQHWREGRLPSMAQLSKWTSVAWNTIFDAFFLKTLT